MARALALDPNILLFDEPTAHLDAELRDHLQVEIGGTGDTQTGARRLCRECAADGRARDGFLSFDLAALDSFGDRHFTFARQRIPMGEGG